MDLTAKRFGVKRLILSDMGYTDSFSIPAGHRITHVTAKALAEMTTGGALSIGSANSGIESASFSVTRVQAAVAEEATITFTGGVLAPGNVTIDGDAIAMTATADTTDEVAALIGAATFTNWDIVSTVGSVVTIRAKTYGDKSLVVFADTDSTGVTASVAETITGTGEVYEEQTITVTAGVSKDPGDFTLADVTVSLAITDNTPELVAAKARTALAGSSLWNVAAGTNSTVNITAKTAGAIADPTWAPGTTGVVSAVGIVVSQQGVDAATAGDITVAGETVAITLGTPTTASVATQIAAHSFTDWTVSRVDSTLTFTAKGEGARDNVTVSLDTATGITFSSVTTTGGVAHAEIAAATTLANSVGGVTDIPVVASGCFAPVATDKTAYINLGHGDLVNNVVLCVGLEKYI